ncbi:MAG TPA: sugar-binding domain-containing protein [Clostridia bacterium]
MILNLNGEWKVLSDNIDIKGKVPGDVTADLFAAGIIPDPYYGDNYKNIKKYQDQSYKYSRTFNVDKELLSYDIVELVLKGIDTFADIKINGTKILKTSSMFLEYRYDIKPILKLGENEISVTLFPASQEINKHDNKKYGSIFNKNRIFLRKAQCHFGWDWAPDFVGYGIFRDVYLEAKHSIYIKSVSVFTKINGDIRFLVKLSKSVNDYEIVVKTDDKTVTAKTSGNVAQINLTIDNPKLWWPNGYGEQFLYDYCVEIKKDNQTLNSYQSYFGIREVSLCEDAIDSENTDFCFLINNKRIFARGSNWVPADIMTGCITKEKYRNLVFAAKNANYNMLRVWGGGLYESDDFYRACDEAGIMIWQDFMFACQDIPDDIPEFLNIIKEEAQFQVQRLMNHPCIVYWCGGNEKTGCFAPAYPQYGNHFQREVLRGICNYIDGTRPYGNVSPTSVFETDNDRRSGDCHRNIGEQCLAKNNIKTFYENFSELNCNFLSEFAEIGCCSYKSLNKFIPKERQGLDDKIYRERFMSNPYADVAPEFMDRELKFATELFSAPLDARDFAKKSSLAQAELLQAGIDYCRINGRCNGVLNWMYNDIWPHGTWEVIDYYMSPKPAFYAQKRAYNSKRVCFVRSKDHIDLNVIDDLHEIKGVVEFGIKTYEGKVVKKECLEVLGGKNIFKKELPLCEKGNYYYAKYEDLIETFDPYKYEKLYPGKIEVSRTKDKIVIKAISYVSYVFIDTDELISDNYFSMDAGQTKEIKLKDTNVSVLTFDEQW